MMAKQMSFWTVSDMARFVEVQVTQYGISIADNDNETVYCAWCEVIPAIAGDKYCVECEKDMYASEVCNELAARFTQQGAVDRGLY